MGPKTPRRDTIEPKTPRRDAMEPKTPRHGALEPRISFRDTIEPKMPGPNDTAYIMSCRDNAYHQANNEQPCDQIYNEFELTGGDDEELEDVPWRKPKTNPSKSQKSDGNATDGTSLGKWLSSEKNQAKEQAQQPPLVAASVQEELLDENFPNVKPSAVNKSSFGFNNRKPVKLFKEEKNKETEQLMSKQHVLALDDSPERSLVEDRRVLDDDVVIVTEDIFSDTTNLTTKSKQTPPLLQRSENRQIPVLGASIKKPTMTKQQLNSASPIPPVSATSVPLIANQMYPQPHIDAYPPKCQIRPVGISSFLPPPVDNSVGLPAEFFIGTSPVRPALPVTRPPLNNFNTAPPLTSNLIPLTNPGLPSPLQAGVAPPLQRPTLLNPPIAKAEVSTRSAAAPAPKDAVKEEMLQQNRNLLAQKQEYVGRLRELTDEMAKLKSKKKELFKGTKTQETEQFLKENNRLQTEIQSKITAVENVIDMLLNMIVKNGGDPKMELKNTDSQEDSSKPKDDKLKKFLPNNNKEMTRDKCSRSRSSSRRRTRSRSPRDRTRLRFRRRLPSNSRSRSRSRRRFRSRHRSSSHSPYKQRGRRSRSQKRDYERQHSSEKLSKSIIARKNCDRKSSSPVTLSKTSSITAQTNSNATVDTRRETQVSVDRREEATKSNSEHHNKKLKIDLNLPQKKVEEQAEISSTETNALEKNAASETSRQRQINYVYYDSETHWCRICNVFPQTAKEYLTHLHSVEHKTEMTNQNMVDYPWHKVQPEVKKTNPNAPTERVPIRGLQFFVSATAWYCKLCDVFMGDLHCASVHLKSDQHEQNLLSNEEVLMNSR